MLKQLEMFGAWSGFHYLWLLCIGWWLLPDFMPPHLPSASPTEIASVYKEYFMRIRFGMVITMLAGMVYLFFAANIAMRLKEIEGGVGMLTMLQIMGGICTGVLTFYPAMWWLIACFRPDRNVELLQMLNDAAWLQFVGGLTLYLPCLITIAIAAFIDKSPKPVFPRWLGFLNAWTLILLLPGQLIFFFIQGPFAWNGLLAFWVPVVVLAVWLIVMTFPLRKAVINRYQEKTSSGTDFNSSLKKSV